ncbi:hypothetical protein SCLARK_001218 [Spiroplasma clarkii]|uniref:Uncharacterized protein n=1 Tax=Spiroplasma clarkii TaxID=2139 RepID=A0A1Y0L1W2_9MOLU|nr:hypothetical protein [Spiroplasma clarkii]ARU91770.1 hypothetical protein SCLARK_001218 [Spiroplasma clarkii]ATX71143.1 hypothetical protein SCLAR_v1c08350 [Spiroplasma clarkii]
MDKKIKVFTREDFETTSASELVVDRKSLQEAVDFVVNNKNMKELFERLSKK